MNSKIIPKTKPTVEYKLSGEQFGFAQIERIAMIHSQAASRISWHAHEAIEILFLLEGMTSYEFSNSETLEIPGGHFLMIPAGMRHRGVLDVRSPVRLCGMMLQPFPESNDSPSLFRAEEWSWLHERLKFGMLAPQRMSGELRRYIRMLQQLMTQSMPDETGVSSKLAVTSEVTWGMQLRLCISAVLLELARQTATHRPPAPTQTVQSAIHYMESHLSEQLLMENVAKAAKCSRARLFQIFKDSTGMAPNDYLQRLRIQRAQQALSQSNQPVTNIALACGFSTSQYFSNVFRKYTGFTPSDYRQKQQQRIHEKA